MRHDAGSQQRSFRRIAGQKSGRAPPPSSGSLPPCPRTRHDGLGPRRRRRRPAARRRGGAGADDRQAGGDHRADGEHLLHRIQVHQRPRPGVHHRQQRHRLHAEADRPADVLQRARQSHGADLHRGDPQRHVVRSGHAPSLGHAHEPGLGGRRQQQLHDRRHRCWRRTRRTSWSST